MAENTSENWGLFAFDICLGKSSQNIKIIKIIVVIFILNKAAYKTDTWMYCDENIKWMIPMNNAMKADGHTAPASQYYNKLK